MSKNPKIEGDIVYEWSIIQMAIVAKVFTKKNLNKSMSIFDMLASVHAILGTHNTNEDVVGYLSTTCDLWVTSWIH